MRKSSEIPGNRPQFHKSILFVDDEHAIRATLPPILKRYGFEVTAVATVAQAMEEIRNHKFDLLICDLCIESEADGLSVVRAMREANPRCMSVILTGYPADDTAAQGFALGIEDYVAKPASADFLIALLADKLTAQDSKGADRPN